MTALFTESDSAQAVYLERTPLTEGMTEKWLQETLFRHSRLLPMDRIEPGIGDLVPICRELPLPRPGGNVFLDLLAVTRHGRLVLVECKLWRNPQARREVVAQILEYAALLRRWSYSDLTARLKSHLGLTTANPLFDLAASVHRDLDETEFSDAVTRNLRSGDFHLLVAGDGIREDMTAIAEHLRGHGARLSLVEFQIWKDAAGRLLIVPNLPYRTEVLRQRIIVGAAGAPLELTDDEEQDESELERQIDPERSAVRGSNRSFWQVFIDRARFDHPDQESPKHGGNNWVKIPMPAPGRWLTAYRYKNGIGLYLVAEDSSGLFEALADDAELLRQEAGLPGLRIEPPRDGSGPRFSIQMPYSAFSSEEEQISWLLDSSNRLINALRPRILAFAQRQNLTS